MFTGLVEGIANVKDLKKGSKEVVLTFESKDVDLKGIALGDSIAINGICLTVVSFKGSTFSVEASHETLSKTSLGKLRRGSGVNIERSLRVGDRLGGHFVTGHVDGTARISSVTPVGRSVEIWVSVSDELAKYIVEKGSVAIDGISLTVNEVKRQSFSVNIIPHTQDKTTLQSARAGDIVNIECDIIGKYVEKFVMIGKEGDKDKRLRGLLENFGKEK
ncbi:MAG: riboflavin synthase [Candidatus Dadabacteria bacterium]|nr:riboflavin synthase [Candidatus Dadabacteria bacterium]NIV41855.1 riboflavin synthase [Candidatus Dadabacteria bacterium]NIX15315.1 riboflavin synthase [Candidatus Dadabacteria bacterium]